MTHGRRPGGGAGSGDGWEPEARGSARGQAAQGSRRGWFLVAEPDHRARSIWLLLAFAAMAVILGIRLLDVQVRQGPQLRAMASEQHASDAVIHAHRGRITDRAGSAIANDLAVWNVFADPGIITPDRRDEVAARLAPALGMGPGKISGMLGGSGRFVYVVKEVSQDVRDRVEALKIPGIGTIPEEKRVAAPGAVPGASFAAGLVGYVDHDGHGQYGVEQYYDKVLHGTDGRLSTLQDSAGNPIVLNREQRRDPRDGRDLQLGIDPQVQYWAEQSLAHATADTQSDSGTILIMDVHTGAIRAWADYPSYDANQYGSAPVSRFTDPAASGLYEPGSVMKVITFAGGLQANAITPQTAIDEGNTNVDGFTIHDWDNRTHGRVTMQQVLEQSLNNGAIQVMQRMGPDAFYKTLLSFGIGAPTGIDVSGEANRPLTDAKDWRPADYAVASFGQGIQTTPVEVLAAFNAVANGGVWVEPHAVEQIIDPDTGQATPVAPTSRQVISPQVAATLTQMMTGVVETKGASGFAAKIPAFKGQVAGKTGTASVPVDGRYSDETICSFAGFLPASNPQFTMLVVLRQPHTTKSPHEGAYLAAPVWHDMAQLIVDAWKIAP